MRCKGKKIKAPVENRRISRGQIEVDYPLFCFKYLTTNKKFNIKYFKDLREKQKAYGALFYTIHSMQDKTWRELYSDNKNNGFETIPYSQINLTPNSYKCTPDTKILVIRFARQKYRMLGIKSDTYPSVFHVIGFDFNYKAYKH